MAGLTSWGEPTQSSGYLTLTRNNSSIYETSNAGPTTSVLTLTSIGIPNGTQVLLDQTIWDNQPSTGYATPDVDFTVSSTVFIMNNNVGTITVTAIEDNLTEGQESIFFKIKNFDSNGVNTGALGCTLKLIDTSLSIFDCDDATPASGLILDSGTVGQATTASPAAGTVVSINPSVYVAGNHTYTITILVPAGWDNTGDEIECTNVYLADPPYLYDCELANFQVTPGGVGEIVTGIASGTITNISPATYQSGAGLHTYTATITVPSDEYDNFGSSITCNDAERSIFNCTEAEVEINPGFVGQQVTGSTQNGTWLSVSPKFYQSGTNTYCVKVVPPIGYYNSSEDYIICCQEITVLGPPEPGREAVYISSQRSSLELFCNENTIVNTEVWIEEGLTINTALNNTVYTSESGNSVFNGFGRYYIVWTVPMTYNGTSEFTYWNIDSNGVVLENGLYNCDFGGPGKDGQL